MKILRLLAVSLFASTNLIISQNCPSLGPDQFLPCGVTQATLNANMTTCNPTAISPALTTTYAVTNIPFAPAPVGGTAINLSDDSQAGPFNIGFPFCFFGVTYNQFWIGSNGWVAFSAGQSNAFTSASIPSAAFSVPRNCIMGPWQDWHPGVGPNVGNYIRYQVLGTAPCRRLVISYTSIPMYQCTTTYGTFQIIIYESTNVIENHITNKPNCGWAGGTAVQGLHNAAGTIGITVPGRNSTVWTTQNNAYRYTPAGAPVTPTLNWYIVGNPVSIGTGSSIVVTPPNQGEFYTCVPEYPACYLGFNNCVAQAANNYPDTVFVQPGLSMPNATITAPTCISGPTQISVAPFSSTNIVQWTGPGIQGPNNTYTITINAGGTYSALISNNQNTCTASATVLVGQNPTLTIVPSTTAICAQNLNGSNTAILLSASGAPSYTWSNFNGVINATPNLNSSVVNFTSTLPAGGIGSVDLTGSDGICTVTNTYTFPIIPNPTVSVTSPSVCPGGSVNIVASNATTYTWSPNVLLSNITGPVVTALNVNFTKVYSVIGTSLGCNSATENSTVHVLQLNPVTPFSQSNFCQYSTITFSANALNASAYEWYGPNGFYSQLQTNNLPNAQLANAGNYTVYAIFVAGTMSCTTSNWIPINVIPVPNIAVIPTIAVCERESATFIANAPGAVSYTWTGPNNYQLNGNNPVFTNLTPTMSGMYTVTAAFSNGNMTCYNSNITDLLVKPILPFNLGPDRMLCSKQDLLLTGPGGATNYNWWGSTSYTSNAQFLYVPSLEPTNSGIYVLEVDLNGCKTFDSVRISVLSPIIFTLTPTNKTICRGDAVNFIVGAAQGSENYAYTWNPDIYLSGPTGSVQAGNPVGTTIYNISAYDIACPNYVIQTSFTLTVNQPPIPNLSLEKNNVCEPLCMLFNSKTNGESLQTVYDFGNNHIVEGDSVMVCLNAGNHYYKISTVGSNGCRGTFDYTVPITVYPKPGADFYWNPETPTTTDNKVTFFPTTKNGKEFKYNWEFVNSLTPNNNNNALDTSTIKNPIKDYYENGKFPVMLVVTNEYGCVDTVFKVIVIDEDFNVFIPNTFTPNNDGVNDVFNVKGIGLKQEGYYMEIFDRWGALVYSTKDLNKGWDGTVKGIKAQDGVYIYKVKVVGENGIGKKEFKGHVTLLK